LGQTSLLYNNGYRVFFPGLKWPEHDVDHPPPPRAKVKEREELYLHTPPLSLSLGIHGLFYDRKKLLFVAEIM